MSVSDKIAEYRNRILGGDDEKNRLGIGPIIAIVFGVLAVIGILIFIVIRVVKSRKSTQLKEAAAAYILQKGGAAQVLGVAAVSFIPALRKMLFKT